MIEHLIQRRRALLFVLIAVTLVLGLGLKTAVIPDNSLRVWFLDGDPELEQYDAFHAMFGNDEVMLLNVHEPKGIFQHDVLTRLEALSTELEGQEGVERVHSILSTKDAHDAGQGLDFKHLFEGPIPTDVEALAAAQKRTLKNPLFVGRLVNADATQVMLWIQMKSMADFDNRRDAFVGEVTDSVATHLGEDDTALGGVGVIYTGLNAVTQRDFGVFITLTYLLMFIVLWWIFRSMKLVAATGGVITVGTVACLGVYGLMDKHMNMVTVLLPTLVIVLGIADAVHFPAALTREMRATPDDRLGAVRRGLGRVLGPCIMTTLTTIAGFMALAAAPMQVVRELGIFAAIGIFAALIASAVLMTLTFMSLREGITLPEHAGIQRLLARCADWLRRRHALVWVVTLLISGAGLYGALQLEADTYTLGYMPDQHQVVRDHHTIEARWGNYMPVEYVVTPREGLSAHSPEILNAMEGFIADTKATPFIRDGFGLCTLYRRSQDVFAPSDAPHSPFTQPLVSQLKILTGDPERDYVWDTESEAYKDNVFAPMVTQKGDVARVTLVGKMTGAKELSRQLVDFDAMATAHFGDLAEVHAGGYTPLYVTIIDYIIKSQVQAFFIALGLIFLLMLLWLRSLRFALISLVANALPVGMMLSVMVALGLTLDVASATIAAIVLGVSIDDTIHFLYHWREAEREGMSWDEALDHTYAHAGVAAVITTALLVVGFPILMLAQVKTVFYFGLLTTIAAIAALLADLFVLPLLLKAWPHRAKVNS
jgi:predicted RND superfamily exporter protein